MNTSINTHYIESVELYRHESGIEWLQLTSTDNDKITIHFREDTRENWLNLLRMEFGETWNLKTGEIEKE
jgi:desulfoferrodoxin (superoxide reductase-like protein)